ncbi:MAG: hypothetical protein HKP27_07865 [Myxococcales bacterium]|nr:hypothetical protein [Myxococcales bacterium]
MKPVFALLCTFSLALLALSSAAHSPSGQRVISQLIDKNRAAGRTQTLSLRVSLQLGPQQTVVASGRLDTDPSGNARLELSNPQGIVERHISRRGVVSASRDGRELANPRPFLAPLPLLQLESPIAYRDQLGGRSLGEPVALGYVEQHDCYVLGDKRSGAALWVDLETLDPVQVRNAAGVTFELGPYRPFGRLVLPTWIEAGDGASFQSRLVVESAEAVTLPPDAFQPSWLYR